MKLDYFVIIIIITRPTRISRYVSRHPSTKKIHIWVRWDWFIEN